jgi:hypothetical protein
VSKRICLLVTYDVIFAGVYGCDTCWRKDTLRILLNICASWFVVVNELWRYNFIPPRTNCTEDIQKMYKALFVLLIVFHADTFAGDHLESASPADPSFWVVHPTLERLLHVDLKQIIGQLMISMILFVIDLPVIILQQVKRIIIMICYGHYEHDQVVDAISGNRYIKVGQTNSDVVHGSDPLSEKYNMPFIYDTCKWDHCVEDFDSLLSELYENM